MPTFASELRDCQKRWTALAADTSQVSLRENAPYQMKQLQTKLDAFNRTAQTYLRFINVKLPPPGAKQELSPPAQSCGPWGFVDTHFHKRWTSSLRRCPASDYPSTFPPHKIS